MKHYKKLLSIITSAALAFSPSIAGMTASAEGTFASECKIYEGELPEWIPTDFESAMEFDRTYGTTHIDDGFICCIHRMYGDISDYNKELEIWNGDPKNMAVLEKTYELPDKKCDFSYSVNVFKPESSIQFVIYWESSASKEEDQFLEHDYSFSSDKDGNIIENDSFADFPDCVAEAKAYKEKHGAVSLLEDEIVFCDIGNYGTGYEFNTLIDGVAPVTAFYDFELTDPQIVPLDGGEYARFITYRSDDAGTVTMTFTNGRPFEPAELSEKAVKHYRFDYNYRVKEITENELDPLVDGDCNYDGIFSISDVVLLQKYIMGDVSLKNPENADVNKDGKVDVFDLIRIKKLIINSAFLDDGPLLVSLYDNYTSLDGIHYQYMTIYTGEGRSYTMNYKTMSKFGRTNLYDKLFDFGDENWHDELVEIMNSEDAEVEESVVSEKVIAKTQHLSTNINNYVDEKECISRQISCDRGNKTLYLIGKDDTGKYIAYDVFTSGDIAKVKTNEDIQGYVKMLKHNSSIIEYDSFRAIFGDEYRF